MTIPPDIRTKLDEAVSAAQSVVKYGDKTASTIMHNTVKMCRVWVADPNNTDIGFAIKHKIRLLKIVSWGGTAQWSATNAVESLLKVVEDAWQISLFGETAVDCASIERNLTDVHLYVKTAHERWENG
jgi:hypothetical protein